MTNKNAKTQPELTSVAQIVEAIASGKISAADGTTLIAQLSKSSGGAKTRTIKRNSSGGLYVIDPSFRAYSEKKAKWYTAGVNLDFNVAKALFTDDTLLKEIKAFIESESKE